MILQPGDHAAIVAPSSQFRGADRPLLEEAILQIASWGLVPTVGAETGNHFYLAGDDAVRSAHLMAALLNPEIKVIFCTRGGYGSPRLLRHLNASAVPQSKILAGYSDITSLHLALSRLWPHIELVHGPNVATRQFLGDGEAAAINRQSLHNALFDPDYRSHFPVEFLVPGSCSGRLVGGCLSMVSGSIGTPYAIDGTGAVVFLEDTGEAPFRIDRMITHLRNAGVFDDAAGVAFGIMSNCSDPYNDLREVIKDLLGDLGVPVVFGVPSGHGDRNYSLRLGTVAMLDESAGTFQTVGKSPP